MKEDSWIYLLLGTNNTDCTNQDFLDKLNFGVSETVHHSHARPEPHMVSVNNLSWVVCSILLKDVADQDIF